MSVDRYLIINADDFGQSIGVNRGIIKAHEQGVVTSASLMVRWPAAARAAAYCADHPSLSLGLHLDVGEWVYRAEKWSALYEVADLGDRANLLAEVHRQLDTFRYLTGKDPTHLDSHQHAHRQEPLLGIMMDVAHQLQIPLRHYNSGVYYCGDFYGQTEEGLPYPEGITEDHFCGILEELPQGLTEIGCHPGEGQDLDTMYIHERAQEVKVLCDPKVRSKIAKLGMVLCSFARFHEITRSQQSLGESANAG